VLIFNLHSSIWWQHFNRLLWNIHHICLVLHSTKFYQVLFVPYRVQLSITLLLDHQNPIQTIPLSSIQKISSFDQCWKIYHQYLLIAWEPSLHQGKHTLNFFPNSHRKSSTYDNIWQKLSRLHLHVTSWISHLRPY